MTPSRPPEHEELRLLLGAHVLGGLDAGDRAAVEEHLAGCASCREEVVRLAPLPGLLRRLWPMLLATVFITRRAAPARPRAAATAAGVASAGWGAVVFAWACPYDEPVYIALWFGLALIAGAVFGRLLLPRLLRW